jgi:hypothetical protein
MASDPEQRRIAAIIGTASTRVSAGVDGLARRLSDHCWPGGVGDRTELTALEWVSRWRPARAALAAPECGCARGRCPVCN